MSRRSISCLTLSLMALSAAVSTAAPIVPCGDARGCPDLVVSEDGLRQGRIEHFTFDADHCAVVEGTATPGRNRLLTFSSVTPNLGQGDLVIGDPANWPALFTDALCHHHRHFVDYSHYRLWTAAGHEQWRALRAAHPAALSRELLDANPAVAGQMVRGRKQGFCLIDVQRIPGVRGAGRKYTSCASNQGVSAGWADAYPFFLDGQWINVTDLPAGDYVLEVEVNPERLFTESEYANNSAAVPVTLPPVSPRQPYPPYKSPIPPFNE